MKSVIQAGASKVNISPALGTLINGDFIVHYARFVHDELYAKALVLKQGNKEMAIVVVDICAMPKDFLDELRAEIAEKTGIDMQGILISSTHTHFAGSVSPLLLVPADLPYRQRLPQLILKAVQQAQKNKRPARFGFGAIDLPEHVVCRRYYMKPGYEARNPVTGGLDKIKTNPFGDEAQIDKRVSRVDPQLSYVAVQGMDQQWISLLGNYSMHYVGDCQPGTITADYFGVFSGQIASKLKAGNDFVGILSNGTSGEASIWDFLEPNRYPKVDYEKSWLIGSDLAERVFQSLEDVHWETDPALSVLYDEIPVNVRKPSPAELETAKRTVSETDYEKITIYENPGINFDQLRRLYAREQVLLNDYPDTVMFPVQAVKIGRTVIGALGGEFFAETGLWLKEKSGRDRYFTICFSNGYTGYVPPAHELDKGGYETWRCRSSYLEAGAENVIRDKLLQLIKSI